MLHLVKRSPIVSTGSEKEREPEARPSSSLTISIRQETIARSLPDAKLPVADAAFGMQAEAGRHQITVLSPKTKLRWSSRACLSEEAVDRRMTRKVLCGTGIGRLRCGPSKPLEDGGVMRRWMACSWFNCYHGCQTIVVSVIRSVSIRSSESSKTLCLFVHCDKRKGVRNQTCARTR